jgi:hypothetical protein
MAISMPVMTVGAKKNTAWWRNKVDVRAKPDMREEFLYSVGQLVNRRKIV